MGFHFVQCGHCSYVFFHDKNEDVVKRKSSEIISNKFDTCPSCGKLLELNRGWTSSERGLYYDPKQAMLKIEEDLDHDSPESIKMRLSADLEKKLLENIIMNENMNKKMKAKGPCFIATAVYGDYDSEQLLVLRRWRDEFLFNSKTGRRFIKWYYINGPIFANYIEKLPLYKLITRKTLDLICAILKIKYKW